MFKPRKCTILRINKVIFKIDGSNTSQKSCLPQFSIPLLLTKVWELRRPLEIWARNVVSFLPDLGFYLLNSLGFLSYFVY